MSIKKISIALAALSCLLFTCVSCRISYSLSGASIHADAKTVSIPYFPNTSTFVVPSLASAFTDAMQEKFANQTKLELVREDGDLAFEGEITQTSSTPTAVTASNDFPASMNRLSVTVKIRFTNRLQPEYNFEKTFTHYTDFDSNKTVQSEESNLVPIIVKMLVDDIYMASVSNW